MGHDGIGTASRHQRCNLPKRIHLNGDIKLNRAGSSRSLDEFSQVVLRTWQDQGNTFEILQFDGLPWHNCLAWRWLVVWGGDNKEIFLEKGLCLEVAASVTVMEDGEIDLSGREPFQHIPRRALANSQFYRRQFDGNRFS